MAPRWLTKCLFCSVRALQSRLQISINGLHFTPHCDYTLNILNILLLQTISVNDTNELWPHLKALDFGLPVKAACRSCGGLESAHFNITSEVWVFASSFLFYPTHYYILPSCIRFSTYSMLFIKDKVPSQILASCKTFHGGVFSWRLCSMNHMCMLLCLFWVWGVIAEIKLYDEVS